MSRHSVVLLETLRNAISQWFTMMVREVRVNGRLIDRHLVASRHSPNYLLIRELEVCT